MLEKKMEEIPLLLPPPPVLRFLSGSDAYDHLFSFKTDSFSCIVCAKKIKNVEEGGGAKQDMNITYVHVLYNRKVSVPCSECLHTFFH